MEITLLFSLIGLCDGLGHLCLTLGWLCAWPFTKTARGLFAVSHWLSFGSHRP